MNYPADLIVIASAFWPINDDTRVFMHHNNRMTVAIPPEINFPMSNGYAPDDIPIKKEEIRLDTFFLGWWMGYGPESNILAIRRDTS